MSTTRRAAPVLMIQGTGSGVGKSLLTAALCRIAHRRGMRVAPFKAQNMSNNAAVTIDGGEIGRAQWLQAIAAGVEPDVTMNPVLLKPMADTRSEVVRLGRHDAEATALPWRSRRDVLWPTVTESLADLRHRFELVIAEGAGSPAETNLRSSDIVNMSVARWSDAAVLLVADIDRGGAFASLYGTWSLLDDADRRHFRGFVLNRFRGDPSLLHPAPRDLEAKTGVPVVGVVPWIRHLLPEEDGGPALRHSGETGHVEVGVVGYPRASNLDDLDPLRREPGITLRWVRRPRDLWHVRAVILPGSRNTAADLRWMRELGLADAIRGLAADQLHVVGLCGGYQMMGRDVHDPAAVEEGGSVPGLGLLDIETTMAPAKEIRQTVARVTDTDASPGGLAIGLRLEGYEIHHGRTRGGPGALAWLSDADGTRDLGHATPPNPGGRHWGAYLHGIFASDELRRGWLRSLGVAEHADEAWRGPVEMELDRVAGEVATHLDIDAVLDLARGRA
ncbi:MAG: cobyric acid synthase [Gemmatimonadota bacterium]